MREGGVVAAWLVVAGLTAAVGACSVSHAAPPGKGGGGGPAVHASPVAAPALPPSLDALYPPRARGPVLQLEMMSLAQALDGIVVDLGERDDAGVRANLDKLKANYARVSQLVPEWQRSFPAAPLAGLEAALATGDPAKIMPAVGRLGAVCDACHRESMAAVVLRHHWPGFDAIEVTDPVTKEKLPFGPFKQRLNTSFMGVAVDLEQHQLDNARKQLQAFQARFKALKASCASCHDSERHYYVDKKVLASIAKLEKSLRAKSPDPKAVQDLMMSVGRESCGKCHNVHLPGALARHPGAPPR